MFGIVVRVVYRYRYLTNLGPFVFSVCENFRFTFAVGMM